MIDPRKILFQVTQQDIAAALGQECQPSTCALARCIRRTLGTDRVSIGDRELKIDGVRYRLPLNAEEFVKDFDCGIRPKQISFMISDVIN